jgi:hypothetical protein
MPAMKILYTIFLVLISLKIAIADEIKACSSVLPFICQTPNCSDNKKIAALCDGQIGFTEAGTECMIPRIPMAKCTRGKDATPSVVPADQAGVWYIALKGGRPVVLKTADEVRALFTPVKDHKTAQGLALLLTEDFPLFAPPYPSLNNGWCSTQSDPGKWLNRDAAVSKIEKVDKGFQVQLFTITHVKGADQLVSRIYLIDPEGVILDQVASKTPLWICPGGKKRP